MVNRELYSPELERTYWWFRGRRAILARLLARFMGKASGYPRKVLEVGCGTGGNFPLLSRYGEVVGLDISPQALAECRGNGRVVLGDGLTLPFRENLFDAAIALDILEHVDKDVDLLKELFKVLRDGGVLVLSVPAGRSLWSGHDIALAHRRRYSRRELQKKVELANFKIQKLTFAISFLFPLVFLFRKGQNLISHLGKGRVHPQGIIRLPGVLNQALVLLLKVESLFLTGFSLPFGVSLICIAHKRTTEGPAPVETHQELEP